MKRIGVSIVSLILLAFLLVCSCRNENIIIVHDSTSPAQAEIAEELACYLEQTWEGCHFEPGDAVRKGSRNILLNTDPDLDYPNREAFEITGSPETLIISGSSDHAIIHGVYALLKKMGWSFYQSFELAPGDRGSLDLAAYNFSDAPSKDTRIIFNWHNFLSGCSGWNLEDWNRWMEQARKTGFNTIMVHAYGNNPMQALEFNGIEKEYGYLTSTRKGRDWGTQHVNDVRRMIGGEIFRSAEFGSDAALVEESRRSEAAVGLMQKVFSRAEDLSMDVCYAIDVDTWMANPQDLIKTLPAEALISIQDNFVANPDHPAGKTFYQAQLGRLFKDYPQITHLAAWMRRPVTTPFHGWGTLWLKITYEELPEAWKKEFVTLMAEKPEITRDMPYPAYFAMSRIIRTYREILDDIKPETELLLGSWQLTYPQIADLFMPDYCGFIPLDYSYSLLDESVIEGLKKAGEDRKLYPIVWAHHDDHRYMGRPYIPYENFHDLLKTTNSEGYGIIHWTTHPLDMLFENYERQVWGSSLNEPLLRTIDTYCTSLLLENNEQLRTYFRRWYLEAPMFGRETLDHFMATDRPYNLEGYESAMQVVQKAGERRAILDSISPASLTPAGRKELQYQRETEDFIISFFSNHHHLHQAHLALQSGNRQLALMHADKLNPEETIALYAKAIGIYGASRGEKGLLISLNLRWLPDYTDLRQRLRMEAIRLNFQPTSHDPLAQGAGRYTYFIDKDGLFWNGLGQKETGIGVVAEGSIENGNPGDNWISFPESIRIPVTTLRDHPLPEGRYRLELLAPGAEAFKPLDIRLEEENVVIFKNRIAGEQEAPVFEFETGGNSLHLVVEAIDEECLIAAVSFHPV